METDYRFLGGLFRQAVRDILGSFREAKQCSSSFWGNGWSKHRMKQERKDASTQLVDGETSIGLEGETNAQWFWEKWLQSLGDIAGDRKRQCLIMLFALPVFLQFQKKNQFLLLCGMCKMPLHLNVWSCSSLDVMFSPSWFILELLSATIHLLIFQTHSQGAIYLPKQAITCKSSCHHKPVRVLRRCYLYLFIRTNIQNVI